VVVMDDEGEMGRETGRRAGIVGGESF